MQGRAQGSAGAGPTQCPADGTGHVLAAAIAQEERAKATHGPCALTTVLGSPRVLHFVAINFLIQMSVYGVFFYLPTQVGALPGKKVGLEVGLVAAVPWLCALAAAFALPRMADREGNHRVIAAVTLAVSGLGIAVSAGSGPVVALCFAAASFIAVQPLFWTFPTNYLGGVAAAAGIALINALGALGGFVAPNIKAWADASFGSNQAGLYALACTTLAGAALILALRRGVPTATPLASQA